ncbi:E3 ubiquitin-protein ligase EL5-like [Hordeum vulgare subsp. vulgare]|uniref:E3 ubiquitin-protein ligase EL5-like n=1 Tax=Hordeum vulgare subsp. vulgare TaxID=112509 RepID=UPI000B48588C|nr:E3 ubiquitin-protein ligase EL5-like [Hordeum vulgare subsp. vulgare]
MNSSSLHRTDPIDKPAGRSSKSLDTGWIVLIVFLVLAAVGLLVLAVCCIRRRKQKPRSPAAIPRRERIPAETAVVRIGESGARRLPAERAIVHTDQSGAGEGDGVQATGCPMCLRPYDNEPGRGAPERLNCGHVFHEQCIKPWVAVNLACSVCNRTHIELCGETPGEARAPRNRYSFSHLDSSATTKDDIAVGSSSFRLPDLA